MKKVFLCLAGLLLAVTAQAANMTSAMANDVFPTVVAVSESAPSITAEGVGALKIDMKLKALPKSISGLYDSYSVRVDEYEGHIITFTLDGVTVLQAYARYDQWDVGNDETLAIYRIVVVKGSPVGFDIKGKLYKVGDNVSTLVANKTLKRVDATTYTYRDVKVTISKANGVSTITGLEAETKEVEMEWP